MAELLELLPKAMLYLASGFAFIGGFYFLLDKRFDYFSEISFWVMLIWGFFLTNFIKALCNIEGAVNENVKNTLIVTGSLVIGLLIAAVRNCLDKKSSKWVLNLGRRKTFTTSFWYSLLDDADKPVTVRLKSEERKMILEGVLLRISEEDENPYMLLGYCMKYSLTGGVINASLSEDRHIQMIVRPDDFDEVILIYAEDSAKIIELDLNE